VTGKIFTTVAMKEQAQQQAQEAERKKAEERQLREEKLNEANKKKEEILKTRAEEKKRWVLLCQCIGSELASKGVFKKLSVNLSASIFVRSIFSK